MANTRCFGLISPVATWFGRSVDSPGTPKFSGRDIRRTPPSLLSQMEAFALLLAMLFLSLGTVSAHAGAMTIRVESPDSFKVLSQIPRVNIFLEGEIDAGAPARLAPVLKRAEETGADVYLDSPGGSLLAGMEIGRMLRRAGANTHVGSAVIQKPDPRYPGAQLMDALPGGCYSSCALAFLGGVYRFMNDGSKYGVHRFSRDARPSPEDLESAQVISAAVGAYIREMGAAPEVFDLMVQAGKDSIRVLTPTELTRLNVINKGRMAPEWSIEAIEGAQYLRGFQDTVHGYGKAVFACSSNGAVLMSFYEAGTKRANEIARGHWEHSLLLGTTMTPLPVPDKISVVGDEIQTQFDLDNIQVTAIASSSSFGHAMQLSREAPVFVGYQIDIPQGKTSQKVGSFLRNCLSR